MTREGPGEEDESVVEEDPAGKDDAVTVTTAGAESALLTTDGPSTENSPVGKLVMLND
jgi:hypothetical protein